MKNNMKNNNEKEDWKILNVLLLVNIKRKTTRLNRNIIIIIIMINIELVLLDKA